jgi:hypothetical protein
MMIKMNSNPEVTVACVRHRCRVMRTAPGRFEHLNGVPCDSSRFRVREERLTGREGADAELLKQEMRK